MNLVVPVYFFLHLNSVSSAVMEHVFAIPLASWIPYSHRLPRVLISTSSLDPVSVHISVVGIHEITTTVARYRHVSITLPPSVRLTSTGKSNATVRVTSSGVTSVHCIDTEYGTGDGFLVLPTTQLGKQYSVVNYKAAEAANVKGYKAFVCLSALNTETLVDITTKGGVSFQIDLNPFESYRFDGESLEDLTGTFITSTKLLTVISGVYTRVPSYDNAADFDGLLEQMPPISSFGYKFLMAPFYGINSGYVYRIISSMKSTTIKFSNLRTEQIEANEWYEGEVLDNSVILIESDNPLLVVQYMKSRFAGITADASMMIVPSVESFVNNVTFPVVKLTGNPVIQYNIHVTVNCNYVDELMFDDTEPMSVWERLETYDGEMCVIRGNVTTGVHSVTHHDPEAKFTVAVYGFHDHSAYAYPAGFNLNFGKHKA